MHGLLAAAVGPLVPLPPMDFGKSNPPIVPVAAAAATPGRMVFPRGSQTDELDVMVRARYPIIYVVTYEEERVEQHLAEIAAARNKKLFIWTCTQGIVRSGSE